MKTVNKKAEQRSRRQARIRAKVSGTGTRPRLAVFKSNKYVSAQLIDDTTSNTLASGTTQKIEKGTPLEKAKALGADIAQQAKALKVDTVVFDRGGYIYTGQVRAVAEGAREGGLTF